MLDGTIKSTFDEMKWSFIFQMMKLMYLTLLNYIKFQLSNKINSKKKNPLTIAKCLNPDKK